MFHLLGQVETKRLQVSRQVSRSQRSTFGQFFTPAPIARLIASQFQKLEGDISLVDPGAGMGNLPAAFVERVLQQPSGNEMDVMQRIGIILDPHGKMPDVVIHFQQKD